MKKLMITMALILLLMAGLAIVGPENHYGEAKSSFAHNNYGL